MAERSPLSRTLERIAAGRSARELSRECGANGHPVSHSRIADILFGLTPTYKLLQRLALGLSLSPADTAALFRDAGYVPPVEAETGYETLGRGLAQLSRQLGGPVELLFEGGDEDVSPEEAQRILAETRARYERKGLLPREGV